MKFKSLIIAALAAVLGCTQLHAQATILPPGQTCFQATTGINGMVGTLGTITPGSLYTNGTYGGVALIGGSGSNATANITVSGGIVTQVTILNPGIQYVVGDVLSAAAANIGGTGSGFSFNVASVSINSSLAGGSVGFYIPNTLTFKQTWQDSGEVTLNQSPVPLDQNGCAVIYGAGIYRQILKDSLGNTVWDKLTASTGPSGIFWAGQAGGTPNAITVTDPGFALGDGTTIQFLALSENTGPTTIAVSGFGAISVVKDTSTGPAALSGGEIGPANTPMVTYDATNVEFHLVNPASTTSSGSSASSGSPQGYINLLGQASGDVIQTGDVANTAVIYYSPFTGNQVPIWNGTIYKATTFSELTLTLTVAGSPSNTIQDVCVFNNNGVPTLVAGPSWSTVSAGAGNRGSGAGTAQIQRLQGLWVNSNAITAYNGLSSYSISANQCTIVGSIYVDAAGGTVSNFMSYRQSSKWSTWNFYNRQRITVIAGDSTASWSYATNAWRAANAAAGNSITVFSGLPEAPYSLSYTIEAGQASLGNTASSTGAIGIGYNWSSGAPNGTQGKFNFANNTGVGNTITYFAQITGTYNAPPGLGINTVTALENGLGGSATTWNGTQATMLLTASWPG